MNREDEANMTDDGLKMTAPVFPFLTPSTADFLAPGTAKEVPNLVLVPNFKQFMVPWESSFGENLKGTFSNI